MKMKKSTEIKRLKRMGKDLDALFMHNLIAAPAWDKVHKIFERARRKL